MARKRIDPRTRNFDERTIVRTQDRFSGGMVKDVEAVDLGTTQVANLVNARGHKSAVKGRRGSKLWADMKLPSEATGLELTKTGDNLVSATEVFDPSYLGYMIHIPNVDSKNGWEVLFITEVSSAFQVMVKHADTLPDGVYASCEVNAPMNASYCDLTTGVHYYLLGTRIYAVLGKETPVTWNEYFIHSETALSSSESMFVRVGKDIVLINPAGQYILSDIYSDEGLYVYRANEAGPSNELTLQTAQIPDGNPNSANPSAYNYTYTYGRIRGNVLEDRNSDATFIERESASTSYIQSIKSDLSTISLPRPILNTTYYRTKFNVAINNEADRIQTWIKISENEFNPYIQCEFNSVSYRVFFDFTLSETFNDVASEMASQFYNISSNLRCTYRNSPEGYVFDFYSINIDDEFDIAVDPSSPADSTDILASLLDLSGEGGTYDVQIIGPLVYPTGAKDVTTYPVFRSQDIYPWTLETPDISDARIDNNRNILGWVQDVPAIQFVSGTGGPASTFVTDSDTYKTDILGSTMYVFDGVTSGETSITQYTGGVAEDTYSHFGIIIGDGVAFKGVIGTNKVIELTSKLADTATFVDTTDIEIGTTLFWEDGDYSVVKSVDSITEVTTVDSISKPAQFCAINPTSRNFCDTITDTQQEGFLSVWALNTRYYEPYPNVTVAGYNDGIILGALKDLPELYYTTTDRIYHMGIFKPTDQTNNQLEDGVRSIFPVNDVFSILTQTETHYINPKQAEFITNDFGEFYTQLPDPVLVQKGIGATHWQKFAPGDKGDMAVLTAEPALRFFNGTEYSKNYADGKIQLTELQYLNEYMVLDYDSTAGIHIWGRRSS